MYVNASCDEKGTKENAGKGSPKKLKKEKQTSKSTYIEAWIQMLGCLFTFPRKGRWYTKYRHLNRSRYVVLLLVESSKYATRLTFIKGCNKRSKFRVQCCNF